MNMISKMSSIIFKPNIAYFLKGNFFWATLYKLHLSLFPFCQKIWIEALSRSGFLSVSTIVISTNQSIQTRQLDGGNQMFESEKY